MEAVAAPTEAGAASQPGPRGRNPAPDIAALAAAFPQLEILELIGQGGMGAVYKARQTRLNRYVALKILPESLGHDAAFAERFAREGQLLARLNHPNIVSVHDFGQAAGFYYLVMEYVDGVNLRQAMRAGRFSADQALAIVPRICEALQFAHDEGVLHRDIKPENILLDAKGRVKLVDFGIAKLVGDAEVPPGAGSAATSVSLTQSGAALGTPNYMAPEQVTRPSAVDHRADIYSLGVVFYELLTGELPKGAFARPSERTPVGAEVDAIVLRALESERDRRQQSASELRTQVERVTQATPGAAVSGPACDSPPVLAAEELLPGDFWRRWRRPISVAGVALVALLALVVFRFNRASQISPAPAWSEPERSGLAAAVDPGKQKRPEFVLELDRGWIHTNANAILLMSQTGVEPGQSVLAMVRLPDGSVKPAGSTVAIRNRGGRPVSSLSFAWNFPASFSRDQQKSGWEMIRSRHLRRPLQLVSGEPFELFAVTNDAGGVMTGWLEYHVLPDESRRRSPAGAPAPARAQVRLKPHGAMPGWQRLGYVADVPPGHFLQGICRGTAADDGEASTRFYPAAPAAEADCTWFVRGNFKPEHFRAGAEQLETLRSSGPLEVAVGTPRRLFALTNDVGETFEGWLELVAPAGDHVGPEAEPAAVAEARPTQPAVIKTMVLTGATHEIRGEQNEIRTVSVRTESQLQPGEELVALRRNPDGRVEAASVSFFVRRARASFSTVTYLTWFVPESFSAALMADAARQIQREHSDRPLRLVAGEMKPLFAVTNEVGGVLVGLIRYQREVPDRSNGTEPGASNAVAMVRVRANSRSSILYYSATTPPGYRVEATIGGSEPVEGDSSTSMSMAGHTRDFHSSWRAPSSFKPAEMESADRQILALAARGPMTVTFGTPATVFAVTNLAGEIFEGRFELLGPEGVSSGAGTAAPAAMIPAAAGNPRTQPTPADFRQLAGRIARGDLAAFEEWRRITEELYRGINYRKNEAQVATNFVLMSVVADALGAETIAGNPEALEAIRRSLSIPHLKSFAPRALGIAAAGGHEESLEMLLDHRRWGILLASAVSALEGAAARNNERAVDFLAEIVSDPRQKALWRMASLGLVPAANAGNTRAEAALKTYRQSQSP